MRKIALPLAAALLSLAPLPAAAQPAYRPHLEITPMAGLRTGGELERSVSDLFDTNVKIEESETFGIVVDIPVTHEFQVELLANRQESAFRADEGLFGEELELADVSVENLQAGVLFQWGGGQVLPFVSLTLGAARIDPEVPGAATENRLAGTFGGGVKVFFGNHLGLRFEGRGYWADLGGDSFDDYCDFHDDCFDYDQDLYQVEGAVGLILSF